MQTDYLQFIFQAINTLLTQNSASSTRWVKTFSACSRRFSSHGSASSPHSPPLAAEAAFASKTWPASC